VCVNVHVFQKRKTVKLIIYLEGTRCSDEKHYSILHVGIIVVTGKVGGFL